MARRTTNANQVRRLLALAEIYDGSSRSDAARIGGVGLQIVRETTAGRGRVNIHGAVCLENFDVPFVEPVTVDGDSAVQLLAKIEANNPTKSLIHVIWDNAAYHRCAAVKKWLSRPKCRIHLIQLPAYCPHLNPIERLWAVLHAHVTHNRFYPTQKQFANAILNFLRKTIPEKWKNFRSQVSDNFRIISHQKFRVLE